MFDSSQVFEVLVGLFAEQIADLLQVEIRMVPHASLSAPDELLQAPQLTQYLSGLAHPHSLRSVKGILLEQFLQSLHLAQRIAQLAQLLLGKRIQAVQKVIQILSGGVQHVGQVFEEVFVL